MWRQLNVQLKEALALESERVAKAWAEREKLREEVQTRDAELGAAQMELFQLKESLATHEDELSQLREQRRLGDDLLRGAEERNRLKQVHGSLIDVPSGHTGKRCMSALLCLR